MSHLIHIWYQDKSQVSTKLNCVVVLRNPEKMTVGEHILGWVLRFKRAELNESTLGWYIGFVIAHIESLFGEMPFQKLTTYHVQVLLTCMEIAGEYQHRTIQGVRDTLN